MTEQQNMIMCHRCGKAKEQSEFFSERKKGLVKRCSQCRDYLNNWNRTHTAKGKTEEQKQRRKDYHKKYYQENKEKLNQYSLDYQKKRLETVITFNSDI